MKFGGTSVGSLDRIKKVSNRIAETRARGHHVIAVVSAMSGETDKLIALGRGLSERPAHREMDVLVATGEQVTSALLSIALNEAGVAAVSVLGHQAGIRTDNVFTKARIQTIDGLRLRETVEDGTVAVVAGFQGTDLHGNITTLGRGGSDTSAVAIAAAVDADVCEIYTDVEGVYTTDPNVCKSARKIDRISYEEMIELASLGAKVLQIRSVELGMKYGIPIHVRSTFSDAEGTLVTREDDLLESVLVAGVAVDKKAVKVTMRHLKDAPGVVAKIFGALADSNVTVDMIIQNVSLEGHTDLTFTVAEEDQHRAKDAAEMTARELTSSPVVMDSNVVKVSIVGVGMRNHAGIAARMFRLLANEGINIQAISTSEIKTSCLIDAKYAELAVRTLHDGFRLGEKGASLP